MISGGHMQNSVPDLEEIVHQKGIRLRNIWKKIPRRIGFANVDIYLPRYISHGCDEFIRQIDRQISSGVVSFRSNDAIKEAIERYAETVKALVAHPDDYLATGEIAAQKCRNLRDGLFLVLARYVLDQAEVKRGRQDEKIIYAMDAFRFYNHSRLN